MNLQKATSADSKDIKALYNSAFPAYERPPFSFIRRRVLQGRANLLTAREQGEFMGFAYTVNRGSLVYLFFFAVAEDKRGSGTGSEILRLLRDYYPGKEIFLAREPLDESAENASERNNRREFYLKNGFFDLPYQVREANVLYDLMGTNPNLDVSPYHEIMGGWTGKFWLHFVKTEIINKTEE